MSHSYKKNHHHLIVGVRPKTKAKIGRISNRSLRRKMKQDINYEVNTSPSAYKKDSYLYTVEDMIWVYWAEPNKNDPKYENWQKLMRK